MQVWRINHLIYMDEEEAVAELERHRCVCVGGEVQALHRESLHAQGRCGEQV